MPSWNSLFLAFNAGASLLGSAQAGVLPRSENHADGNILINDSSSAVSSEVQAFAWAVVSAARSISDLEYLCDHKDDFGFSSPSIPAPGAEDAGKLLICALAFQEDIDCIHSEAFSGIVDADSSALSYYISASVNGESSVEHKVTYAVLCRTMDISMLAAAKLNGIELIDLFCGLANGSNADIAPSTTMDDLFPPEVTNSPVSGLIDSNDTPIPSNSSVTAAAFSSGVIPTKGIPAFGGNISLPAGGPTGFFSAGVPTGGRIGISSTADSTTTASWLAFPTGIAPARSIPDSDDLNSLAPSVPTDFYTVGVMTAARILINSKTNSTMSTIASAALSATATTNSTLSVNNTGSVDSTSVPSFSDRVSSEISIQATAGRSWCSSLASERVSALSAFPGYRIPFNPRPAGITNFVAPLAVSAADLNAKSSETYSPTPYRFASQGFITSTSSCASPTGSIASCSGDAASAFSSTPVGIAASDVDVAGTAVGFNLTDLAAARSRLVGVYLRSILRFEHQPNYKYYCLQHGDTLRELAERLSSVGLIPSAAFKQACGVENFLVEMEIQTIRAEIFALSLVNLSKAGEYIGMLCGHIIAGATHFGGFDENKIQQARMVASVFQDIIRSHCRSFDT